MGVFRYNDDSDKELMREVIAAKPFSAQYGRVGKTWENVAAGVSRAVCAQLNTKPVQDRLRLLKKNWRAGEPRSAVGSGIEESLEAFNEQNHYVTLPGLVHQYVRLKKLTQRLRKRNLTKRRRKQLVWSCVRLRSF
ncbi:hypothetical protein PR003_g843 [Phytophthora rubi]|uniref:Uncharacterized protein n=1 Tax=Phytophthora rubi TaxID=129364 RepID=A0A6A3P9G7_9STRA|nr:hypothetical protein PR002_g657 [Phytophthora rubi]KAE9052263.1 hypothetical protein PR001_g672 [Phytophthora rubi]KAE9359264.1 hypothetical protein PR003_g843 [Phytophthora rubi]